MPTDDPYNIDEPYDPQPSFPPPVFQTTPTQPMPTGRPAVWTWFVVYCIVMALVYVASTVFGVVCLTLSPSDLDMTAQEAQIMGWFFTVTGIVLLVAFAAAPFLPRRRWVWVYDLVLIALGMTSCCTLPACIPMLVFWLRPELKMWFGYRS